MKKYSVHIIWAVIVIAALVGGIFYGKSSGSPASKGTSVATARGGFARTGSGGGFVSGQIISVGANSMTVSLANGNSQVVFYSSSTQVMKPTIIPPSTLVAGTRVMIGGAANSDGSLTAQSITVQAGNGFPGGLGNASGTRQFGAGSGQ
ncbi:MAG: DUF5666 domain-containing protein [Minisyncoccia bacterium]